jgi:hypothetical protein
MVKLSLQIMEANNSTSTHEFVDVQSSMDINAPPSKSDYFSTPRKTTSIPIRMSLWPVCAPILNFMYIFIAVQTELIFMLLQCPSFTPDYEEELKPVVGMIFDDTDSVEKFYKAYAHQVGFGVCIGQHKKLVDDVVLWKRFLCDRQGFKSTKGASTTNPSQKAAMATNPSK